MKFREQNPDSDQITPFRDINTLTYAEIQQAYDEVCEDRKDFQKYIKRYQKNKWTKEDEEQYAQMDQWAMMLFTAMKG